MKKRNFFKYAFTVRATALLFLLGILCAAMVGVCKISGQWFFARLITYCYLLFCTAYLLKSLYDWLRYRSR